MTPGQQDADRLRAVATTVRRIRWVGLAFALLQFTLYRPPSGVLLPFARWPVAAAWLAALLAVNVTTWVLTPRLSARGLRRLAIAEAAADAVLASTIVVLFGFDETSRLWPLLTLPLLEAAFRLGLPGALWTWAGVGTIHAVDQARRLSDRADPDAWVAAIPWALGILLMVALISGLLSSRLERARREAQLRAAQLHRMTAFNRDISAQRDPHEVTEELLRAAVALTGRPIAQFHSTASGTWTREAQLDVRPLGTPVVLPVTTYDLDAVGRRPDSVRVLTPRASSIRRIWLTAIPRREGPAAALAVATDRPDDDLDASVTEVLRLLAAHAAVALDNAALLERETRTVEELRALHGLKDDYVSLLSHELKSPLTSVAGYAELLRRRWDDLAPDERERFLATIERNGTQLARLIDDVVDAARAERHELTLSPGPVDVVRVVRAIAEEEVGASPRHRLELEVQPDLPPVWADPDRTRQVVRNLVNNAVKYSPDGGLVQVAVAREDDEVRIEVTDDGVGIAHHLQDQLFQKFRRLPSRVNVRGTGLGLYLSRTFVEQMGGTIGVRSEVDRGSTFWVRLPVARTSSAPPRVRTGG